MKIEIAKVFSRFPAGRKPPEDGDATGEQFRQQWLEKNLQDSDEVLEIILDGAAGYPSSFLEEAFGGLIRNGDYTLEQLRDRLNIVATEEEKTRYIDLIWSHMNDAQNLARA